MMRRLTLVGPHATENVGNRSRDPHAELLGSKRAAHAHHPDHQGTQLREGNVHEAEKLSTDVTRANCALAAMDRHWHCAKRKDAARMPGARPLPINLTGATAQPWPHSVIFVGDSLSMQVWSEAWPAVLHAARGVAGPADVCARVFPCGWAVPLLPQMWLATLVLLDASLPSGEQHLRCPSLHDACAHSVKSASSPPLPRTS